MYSHVIRRRKNHRDHLLTVGKIAAVIVASLPVAIPLGVALALNLGGVR